MKRVHEGKKFSGLSKQDKQFDKCKKLKVILTRIDEVDVFDSAQSEPKGLKSVKSASKVNTVGDKNKKVCENELNIFSKNIETYPEEIIPKSPEVPKVLSNEAKKKIAKAAFEKAKELLKAKKAERKMKENNQICN